MSLSIAFRYPCFDSGERRLFRTAFLLWSKSGSASFVFGRFLFAELRLVVSAHSNRLPLRLVASLRANTGGSGVTRQVA